MFLSSLSVLVIPIPIPVMGGGVDFLLQLNLLISFLLLSGSCIPASSVAVSVSPAIATTTSNFSSYNAEELQLESVFARYKQCTFHLVKLTMAMLMFQGDDLDLQVDQVLHRNQYGQTWMVTTTLASASTLQKSPSPKFRLAEAFCNVHIFLVFDLGDDDNDNVSQDQDISLSNDPEPRNTSTSKSVGMISKYIGSLPNVLDALDVGIVIVNSNSKNSDLTSLRNLQRGLYLHLNGFSLNIFMYVLEKSASTGTGETKSGAVSSSSWYWLCMSCSTLATAADKNGVQKLLPSPNASDSSNLHLQHFHGSKTNILDTSGYFTAAKADTPCGHDYFYVRQIKSELGRADYLDSLEYMNWVFCTAKRKIETTIVKALNGTPTFITTKGFEGYGNGYVIHSEHVPVDDVHLSVPDASQTLYYRKDTQMIALYCQEKVKLLGQASFFFSAFSARIWILILGSYTIAAMIPVKFRSLMGRKGIGFRYGVSGFGTQLFHVFGLILKNGVIRTKLHVVLSFAAILLTFIYESRLTSKIAAPPQPYVCATLKELLGDYGYKIPYLKKPGIPSPRMLFNETFHSRRIPHLLETAFEPVNTREEMVYTDGPIAKPYYTVMASIRYRESLLNVLKVNNPKMHCHVLREPFDRKRQWYRFYGPLREKLKMVAQRLVEFGVATYWDDYERQLIRAQSQYNRKRKLRKSAGADGKDIGNGYDSDSGRVNPIAMDYGVIIIFQLLSYLIALGLLVFVSEVGLNKFYHKKLPEQK